MVGLSRILFLAGLAGLCATTAGAEETTIAPWAVGDDTSVTEGPEPPSADLVTRRFAAAFPERCAWSLGGSAEMRAPEMFDFTFRYDFETRDDPAHALKVYRIFCSAGAYNEQHVYFLWDEDNGLRPVAFAVPSFTAEMVDPDNPDSKARAVHVIGMETNPTVGNSEIDPETGRISGVAWWRGLGDASSAGTWVLRNGTYSLETYEIDPSYDGEQNPFKVIDYSGAK
jgi:hypothetical protein